LSEPSPPGRRPSSASILVPGRLLEPKLQENARFRPETLPSDAKLFDSSFGNACVNQTFLSPSLGALFHETDVLNDHCSCHGRCERVLCFCAKGRRPSESSSPSIPAIVAQPAAPRSKRDGQQGRAIRKRDQTNRQRNGCRSQD
jgi:hypothetical protein